MSSSLVALALAIALTAAVVVIGLRRNLSETTREGLPRFEGGSEGATTHLDLYEGGERPRRPLSWRQRLGLAAFYLVLALMQVVDAVQSSDDRLLHVATAFAWALGAVVILLNPMEAGFFRSDSRKSGAEPN